MQSNVTRSGIQDSLEIRESCWFICVLIFEALVCHAIETHCVVPACYLLFSKRVRQQLKLHPLKWLWSWFTTFLTLFQHKPNIRTITKGGLLYRHGFLFTSILTVLAKCEFFLMTWLGHMRRAESQKAFLYTVPGLKMQIRHREALIENRGREVPASSRLQMNGSCRSDNGNNI